jgi:hypothetical protein
MKRGVCCLWGRDLGFLALSMETKGAGVGTVALRSRESRARASRDITVPRGVPQIFAISR